MRAHEARARMLEAKRKIIHNVPLKKAMDLIEEAVDQGNPGVNFRYPTRTSDKDPLVALGPEEEAMLADALREQGYTVEHSGPTSNDQRDIGTFRVTWGDAKPPQGDGVLDDFDGAPDDFEERCPHCHQPWAGHTA